MYDLLKEKNTWAKPLIEQFAAELVRTPSSSLAEASAADIVQRQMEQIGYDKVHRDPAGNVVGVMLGREGDPTVVLISHMDTVAPGREEAWSQSPYSGTIANGRLFGLGASDCKGGLAGQVFAGDLLKRSLLPLRGNLVVAATVAEENGCAVGVRRLIEKTLPELEIKPTFAVLGEPTGLGLYYGHDGWMEVDVRVEGANSFQVGDVANAIFDDLQGGQADATGVPERQSVCRPRFEDHQGVRRATIRVNRRLASGEDSGDVLGRMRHEASLVARNVGAVAVEVAVREEVQKLYTGRTTLVRRVTNSWSTDPFHPLMERSRQALTAAGCQVRPGRWQLGRLGLGTAGGVLVNEYKVPTVCYGPGEEALAHAVNESVSLEALSEHAYGTAAIVHSLIGVPVFGWTADEI